MLPQKPLEPATLTKTPPPAQNPVTVIQVSKPLALDLRSNDGISEEMKSCTATRSSTKLTTDGSDSDATRDSPASTSPSTSKVRTSGPSGLAFATLAATGADSHSFAASSDISATLPDSGRERKLHQINKSAVQTHSLQQSETSRPGPKTAFSAFSRTPPSAKIRDYSTSETQSSADSNGNNRDSESSSEDGGK